MSEKDKKREGNGFVSSIDSVRKNRGLPIGESKLFDDLYEASQEGSPLYETISELDQPPLCETVGDMRELMTSEPERLLAVVHRVVGYIDAENIELIDVKPEPRGNFCLMVQVARDASSIREIKVDAMGYPVSAIKQNRSP